MELRIVVVCGEEKTADALEEMLDHLDKFHRGQEITIDRAWINSQTSTRHVVNQAKRVLIEKMGVSETQALYTVQILAHNRGVTLREMAEKILAGHRLKEESA